MIRPLAICVIRDGERILVAEGRDPARRLTFYRPLGGGIEFGELSAAAVVRELREELGAEVVDLRCLGTVENIFTFNGAIGHELVIVYQARFVDPSFYKRERMDGWDGAGGKEPIVALWKPLRFFAQGHAPLYPDGLLELVTGQPHPAIICANSVLK
jgi:8-oxo-dGTP pyrophosphatase MutT (NUDIX family)